MKQEAKQPEDGYIVLITILILGVVATTVALFLLITGTDAGLASAGVEAGAQARAGAYACAELALESIQSNTTLVTPSSNSSTIDSTTQTECTYNITGSSPNYSISAVGTVQASSDNYVHRMSLTLDQVTPKLHVASWQDAP